MIHDVAVTQDGRLAASESLEDDLVFWDLVSRRPIMKMRGDKLHGVSTSLSSFIVSALTCDFLPPDLRTQLPAQINSL